MESNHVMPRYQRGAVTVRLVLRVWSRKRSNLLLSSFNRPLHRQSFRTMGLLSVVRVVGGTRTRILRMAL